MLKTIKIFHLLQGEIDMLFCFDLRIKYRLYKIIDPGCYLIRPLRLL